ncbi:hypothetical protein [Clostridium tertium]|uniref:Uncharacterized protein n=1 Tax=Clostridium tertium TaxID=1559 RepID=A0A6N3AC74_9CLOT
MSSGYNKIFWGILFTLFNINLFGIKILPTFVALLIIASGIKLLIEESNEENFKKALIFNNIRVVITILLFVLDFTPLNEVINSKNIISQIIININFVLDLITMTLLLKGSSEVFNKDKEISLYCNKRTSFYICIFSALIIIYNLTYIFLNQGIETIIAIGMLIIWLWIAFVFKRLHNESL